MPANVDAPRNIIEEFDARKALQIGYLYRVKESENAKGDHIRELTFNDGRYEGENREELAKLRRNFLKIEDENTKLVLENTKFLSEIDTKDRAIAEQAQIIKDLHRKIPKLQKDNSNLKDESKASIGRYQAENKDLRSQLTQQSRELQSKNDRTTSHLAKIEQLNGQLKDAEAVQNTIAERECELTMMKNSYDDLLATHQDLDKNLERHQEDLLLTETSLSDRTAELETVTAAYEVLVEQGKLKLTETALTTEKSIADALRKRDAEHRLQIEELRLSEAEARDKQDALSKELAGYRTRLEDLSENTHWNGISVKDGNLNFGSAVDLSKLSTPILDTIKMELGLSDLSDFSDLQAPDENSDEWLLKELLVGAFEKRYPPTHTSTELETVQKELTQLLTQLTKDKSESPEKNETHKKRIPSRVCCEEWWNGIPVENGKLRLTGQIFQAVFPSELMHLIPRQLYERGMINLDLLNSFEHRSPKADIIKEFENRKVT